MAYNKDLDKGVIFKIIKSCLLFLELSLEWQEVTEGNGLSYSHLFPVIRSG